MSRTNISRELIWQEYLMLRDRAQVDWDRVARIAERVATEFLRDSPHGGDVAALANAVSDATANTEAVTEHYWRWARQRA